LRLTVATFAVSPQWVQSAVPIVLRFAAVALVVTLPLKVPPTAAVTVTALVAVKLPSTVVTVMVVVPAAMPVTKPVAFTVATPGVELDQVTFLLVALAGATVAVSCVVPLTVTEAVAGATLTPVTGTTAVTVIALVAVKLPSTVVTVIVAVPVVWPVTKEIKPLGLTVATLGLELDQVTFLLVALAGATVAVSCVAVFTGTEVDVGLTLTPVTATEGTVMVLVAVLLPS